MQKKLPSISVFFPCYHDWGTIASMVLLAQSTLKELTADYEIIVVNDGSRDHSRLVLDELEAISDQIRVIHHEKNKGYGGALRSGFAACTKEWIFYTDGDAQYDVCELKNLVSALTEQADLVNGYKISRSDPLHRIVIGRLYHWMVKLAFGLKIRDVDCDFRLMHRKIFEKVELKSNSGVICLEMMKKIQDAGFNIAETPVHHFHRAHGKSQFFNFSRIARVFRNLVKLWFELVVFSKDKKESAIEKKEKIGV